MSEQNVKTTSFRSLAELGAALKAAREARKLSLEDISTMTCIRGHFLEGIEAGDFSAFTSWVYARGFVRTYLNLLSRMDLWSGYDLFLSDTPPVFGSTEEEPPVGKAESDPASPQKVSSSDKVAELPRADTVAMGELEVGDVDEGDEPATPVDEDFRVDRLVEDVTRIDGISDRENAGPASESDDEPAGEEDEERLAPLMSETSLLQKESPAVETPEPSADRLPQRHRRVGDGVTVRLPKEAVKPQAATPNPAQAKASPEDMPPLLMNALTRRKPGGYVGRRRRHGGLALALLTVVILLGVAWLWWRRGEMATEAQHAQQQQAAAVQAQTVATTESKVSEPARTVAADIVHVTPVPATEATSTTPIEPVVVSHDLVIAAKGDCWLEVFQNDKRLYGKVIRRGAQLTFPLEKGLRVTFGAAQHVTVSVAGSTPAEPGSGVVRLNYAADGTATKR